MAICLQTSSPLIQTLRAAEVDDPAALSKAICELKVIRHLYCVCRLSPEALLHVAALPHLHSLEVENEAGEILDVLRTDPLQHYFTSLRQLCLAPAAGVAACTALLDAMRPKMLQTLLVTNTAASLASDYEELFHCLSRTCSSLDTLRIQMILAVQDLSPITSVNVKPLLSLSNMVHLHIKSSIDITNATIEDMAAAWPNLRTLILRNNGRTCGITLDGLIPLAKQCPYLHKLAIPLHASASDKLPTSTVGLFVGPLALTKLIITGSAYDRVPTDVSNVSTFLCGLFPNLAEIQSLDCELGMHWNVIKLSLKLGIGHLLPEVSIL
jgi:hypothetical protein